MRKSILLVLLFMMTTPILARAYEPQTLVSREVAHGGFGGPVVKFTEINGDFGVLVGGRGGWIIDHTFVIGGGGYGLSSDIAEPDTPNWGMGYGGLELEYIINSSDLVHFSAQFLIGAGGLGYRLDGEDRDNHEWDGDAFFVAEPGANVILNVLENFRAVSGVSYRYVNGVNEDEVNWTGDSDLGGPSILFALKFGFF